MSAECAKQEKICEIFILVGQNVQYVDVSSCMPSLFSMSSTEGNAAPLGSFMAI